MSRFRILFLLTLLFLTHGISASAQVRVSGRVYDFSKYNPLEAVSVLSTSGLGTVSDSTGRYSIIVKETDSIWFSYLNKPTPKYPVKSIVNVQNFEISLHVNATELREVRIMPRNYKLDSAQNRQDYARAFNFQKPGVGSSLTVGPNGGAGLDLDEFINMFKFRKNRRMLAFQSRLMQEEEQRYIDHRFNRALIIRLTQLRGPSLDGFIERYRPTINFIDYCTEYELQDYIKKSFRHYQQYLNLKHQLEGK